MSSIINKDFQKIYKKLSIERIYDTQAYDILEAYTDDDQGGDIDNCMMADKFDRQSVVNLLFAVFKKEQKIKK